MITLIAAASENNALGYKGDLLWHLPRDFRRFKELTTGHCIIMGRKTFETFPKLLPNRTHIIISRQFSYTAQGCIVVGSLEEAVRKAQEIDKDPYIIGGGEIYHLAMEIADKIELTRVHAQFDQADAFFPEISLSHWKLVFSEFVGKDERHLYDFTFETYVRI
ncbi:MAG: dihydrofolate reductase [Bacteroidota bacterium]|nr:dihydrofolate reductase [Bacteroidota bacterium]